MLTVAAVTFANGGDNIGVYVPVFASINHTAIAAYCVVFVILVGALVSIARYVATRRRIAEMRAMLEVSPPVYVMLTKADLIGAMSKGMKPRDQWRIGAEHEKFGFHKGTWRPVSYDEPQGIRAMLEGLQRFGWAPVEENGHLIALLRDKALAALGV